MTLEAGERFAVIVEITTPGAIHPVAIEYSSSDKGLTVDLSDGEGYISYRGSSWERVEAEQKLQCVFESVYEKCGFLEFDCWYGCEGMAEAVFRRTVIRNVGI